MAFVGFLLLPIPIYLVGKPKLDESGPFPLHTRTDGSDKGLSVGIVVGIIEIG